MTEIDAENFSVQEQAAESKEYTDHAADNETRYKDIEKTISKTEDPMEAQAKEEEAIINEEKDIEEHLQSIRIRMMSMTENEIKIKINELRDDISRDERTLRQIFKENRSNKSDIDELKKSRDELHEKAKEMAKEAQEERKMRDDINKKIAELKKERGDFGQSSRNIANKIREMKKERDELNKLSKGTTESLMKRYESDLKIFLEQDIPLTYEQDLFGRLLSYEDRVNAAIKANELHKQIKETFDETKKYDTEGDALTLEIKDLSEDSQRHHVRMQEIFKEVDKIRKEADGFHRKLIEKYELSKPQMSKIDPLKRSIAITRKELDVYLGKTKDIEQAQEEVRLNKTHSNAQKKLKENGRLSLEDLSMLIEKGDIRFE